MLKSAEHYQILRDERLDTARRYLATSKRARLAGDRARAAATLKAVARYRTLAAMAAWNASSAAYFANL